MVKYLVRNSTDFIVLWNYFSNTIVYESVRVKTAKDHGSDIVEAMYEDEIAARCAVFR